MIFPKIFKSFPNLLAVQSMRYGGVSKDDFDSLNLGLSSGDNEELVLKNRELFFKSIAVSSTEIVLANQIHGDKVLFAERAGIYDGFDAHITNRKRLFLTVSIADCTPILIYDAKHQAVAAVHSGWRGTAKRILHKTLLKMNTTFDTMGKDCFAFIGTCISGDSYEVDDDVAQHFSHSHKRYDESRRKYFLDLKSANLQQLQEFNIPLSQVEVSPFCTFKSHKDFFSFRHDKGKTGRMFALIGLC